MTQLLPCPFCGADAFIDDHRPLCSNLSCNATTMDVPAWNLRRATAVPREPTGDMLMAGMRCYDSAEVEGYPGIVNLWKAMYDAALQSSESKGGR